MADRLPSIQRLADEVRLVRRGHETVEKSLAFLASSRAELQAYNHPEDLGVAAYDDTPDLTARALAINFDFVRNALLEQLWSREIFIGPDVVDELLFYAARRPGVADPLLETLEFLRDRRATRPGFVLFPLHSFGILGAGALQRHDLPKVQYTHPEAGIALTPQTNVLRETLEWIERTRVAFNVRKRVDPELIRHWHRSRAPWLERNALLAIRMTTQRGSYYATERVVLSRIRAATAQLAMVAAFQNPSPDPASHLFSSSHINNWETLDIHHYMVFSDHPRQARTLAGDCVPIHGRGSPIVELSDLSIEIDPTYRGARRTVASIEVAVRDVYRGHLRHMWRRQRNVRTRTYDRLFEALAFFLRSFQGGGRGWSGTVSLATAFEMLLTDSYSSGVSRRLERRLKLVLRGTRGTVLYQEAFRAMYKARGDLVHAGTEPTGLDLRRGQQAFVVAFCVIAGRISHLSSSTEDAMLYLTGDDPAADAGS
jgi:hypothetical protein